MMTPPFVVLTSIDSLVPRSPLNSITRPPFVVAPRTAPPTRFNTTPTVHRLKSIRPLTSAMRCRRSEFRAKDPHGADEHFVADVPVIVSTIFRTTRKNLRATGFDSDLLASASASAAVGAPFARALAPEPGSGPTLYGNASVLLAVDRDRAAAQRERLLSDFAIADQPVVVPVVSRQVSERSLSFLSFAQAPRP
jgi:hypothetical protein